MKSTAQKKIEKFKYESSIEVPTLSEDYMEESVFDSEEDIEDDVILDDSDNDVRFVNDEFEIFNSGKRGAKRFTGSTVNKSFNQSDSMKAYLKEIGRTDLLTFKEEQELARSARAGDQSARMKLAQANLRLVVSVAKRYLNKGINMQDLIQEGNLGLLKAVDRFDPELGYRFSTYATWWIKQAITRALADKSRLIRLPVHMNELLIKVKRVIRKLNLELGRTPTTEEIAKCLKVKAEKVELVLNSSRKLYSLDAKVGTEYDSTFGDLLEDNVIPLPTETTARGLLKEDVVALLNSLNLQEKSVLEMRYGLRGEAPMSLTKIGDAIGVSKERARQIELKALRKLRNNKATSELKSYIS